MREAIVKARYPAYPHQTGQRIGVGGHEQAPIVLYNQLRLEESMIVMLEPAAYLPGEDRPRLELGLLVTSGRAEVMGSVPLG